MRAAWLSAFHPLRTLCDPANPANMKSWIATVMMATFSAGCAGHHASTGAPQTTREAASMAPSDEDADRAYRDFLYRSTCRGVAHCALPWLVPVSLVKCKPVNPPGRVRCNFVAGEQTLAPGSGHTGIGTVVRARFCAGLFQRKGNGWRMVSVLGECLLRRGGGTDH